MTEHEKQLTEAQDETCAWAAQALNCKQALAALLKAGAQIPTDHWTPEYRDAVLRASKILNQSR